VNRLQINFKHRRALEDSERLVQLDIACQVEVSHTLARECREVGILEECQEEGILEKEPQEMNTPETECQELGIDA